MLRLFFSSRLFLSTLVISVLIVAGSLLYKQHVRQGIHQQLVESEQFLRQLNATNRTTHIPQNLEDLAQTEIPLVSDNFSHQMVPGATETLTKAGDERIHTPDELFRSETVKVNVSPFGLGPYPELPEGWTEDTWDSATSVNKELLSRVMLKMWNEGRNFDGIGIEDNGLIYPIIRGTVYVKWGKTFSGEKYIYEVLGHPDDFSNNLDVRYRKESDFAPGTNILDFYAAGINPYEYLDLE